MILAWYRHPSMLLYFVPTVLGPGAYGIKLFVTAVKERKWQALGVLIVTAAAGVVGVLAAAGKPLMCYMPNSAFCMDNQVIWYILSDMAVFGAGLATMLLDVKGERREGWEYSQL